MLFLMFFLGANVSTQVWCSFQQTNTYLSIGCVCCHLFGPASVIGHFFKERCYVFFRSIRCWWTLLFRSIRQQQNQHNLRVSKPKICCHGATRKRPDRTDRCCRKIDDRSIAMAGMGYGIYAELLSGEISWKKKPKHTVPIPSMGLVYLPTWMDVFTCKIWKM